MMYLSRIQLINNIGQYSQLGRLLTGNNYGVHRLLWDLFESGERFLFREESSKEQLSTTHNLPLYYVLSKNKPKDTSPIFKTESKVFSPMLSNGEQLAFRLRANPTVSRRDSRSQKSRRHDVVMDAQQQWLLSACKEKELDLEGRKSELRQRLQRHHPDYVGKSGALKIKKELNHAMEVAATSWLQKRGSDNGYELIFTQATGYRWNALPDKHRNAGFSSMDYEGKLTVVDVERFVSRLFKGFGPSKGFGCGLMLIRRS